MKKTTKIAAFSIITILAIPVFALAGPVPDTGQTTCYDNSAAITCPQPGEDFYGQDASFLINPPSYTKLDANGNALSDDATEWVTVRDNVTGLIWEVKTDDGSIHDKDNVYTWYDNNPETNGGNAGTAGDETDTEDFIAALNAASFGGFSDWRLPTVKDLSSIVNSRTYNPAINTDYFPNTVSSNYWSSTTGANDTNYAWHVYFYSGNVNYVHKSYTYYVRAVRGGQSGSFDNLVINGDGTVTDTSTGMMWQKETAGSMNWEAALGYCENLSFAGYDDWRMPNIKELRSIVHCGKYSPAINTEYFPNTVSSGYWSSTTYRGSTNYAWHVHMYSGNVFNRDKSDTYYVRAVRGGQVRSLGHLVVSALVQGARCNISSEKEIIWNTQDIQGNIRISLSRDGGKEGTFETLVDSTENNGSYTWIVTGPKSFNCALKIEPINEPDKGTTQSLF
ncbi:DUF1566 domain-containing protein, partial [bacterium]|nr:DUF1566 domain-containing protein [bacterium]